MPNKLVNSAILQCASTEPSEVAQVIIGALRSLHAELTLVVGVQAASALFAHAVHRTRSSVGWTVPAVVVLNDNVLDALGQDLAGRSSADSLSAGEFLLSTLIDHLVSLIGNPLTRRMLHSAWGIADADPSSQESL